MMREVFEPVQDVLILFSNLFGILPFSPFQSVILTLAFAIMEQPMIKRRCDLQVTVARIVRMKSRRKRRS